MRVIVNCDDFGLSEDVNAAIIDALEQGVATSATLLANGPAFESAAEYARSRQKRFSFGVHLNLTQFAPCSTARLDPLLDDRGEFAGRREGRRPGCGEISPRLARAILHELTAQIDRCVAAGLRPSHLDSHQHAHWSPCVLGLVSAADSRFGIGAIRPAQNRFAARERPGAPKRAARALYNLSLRWLGFAHPERMSSPGALLEHLARGRAPDDDRTWECMLHPGHPDVLYRREMEDWTRGLHEHRGRIELITYRGIRRPGQPDAPTDPASPAVRRSIRRGRSARK